MALRVLSKKDLFNDNGQPLEKIIVASHRPFSSDVALVLGSDKLSNDDEFLAAFTRGSDQVKINYKEGGVVRTIIYQKANDVTTVNIEPANEYFTEVGGENKLRVYAPMRTTEYILLKEKIDYTLTVEKGERDGLI